MNAKNLSNLSQEQQIRATALMAAVELNHYTNTNFIVDDAKRFARYIRDGA